MKVTVGQKSRKEQGYELSQVTDGLWTVEGAYSGSSAPADYFKPSPLYQKRRLLSALKMRKFRSKERARKRAGQASTR